MNSMTPVPESDIEDRFRITGARPVAFLLVGYAKHGQAFSVQSESGEVFLTTLLAADAERGRLIFDCSGSQEANRHVLASARNVFFARPDGIAVQFVCGAVKEAFFEGSRAFSVALPNSVARLQRREFFRIETPRGKPLVLFARRDDGALLKWIEHNISVDGIGVESPLRPEGLSLGLRLPNCHFALPEDAKDFHFAATVRHCQEITHRNGNTYWRIGLQFDNLSSADKMRIQRYIAKIEHERHELS